MDEWTAFVKARLDEDEAAAKAWLPPVRLDGSGSWYDEVGESNLGPYSIEHARLHDPARALREVAALRAVLARHSGKHMCPEPQDDEWVTYEAGERVVRVWACGDVRSLADIWKDHPDHPLTALTGPPTRG